MVTGRSSLRQKLLNRFLAQNLGDCEEENEGPNFCSSLKSRGVLQTFYPNFLTKEGKGVKD